MVVAVARVALHISQGRSLKGKRQVVRSILDRTRSKFTVSAAEVGDQDLWQRAELGFAYVSGDAQHGDEVIQKVVRFVESLMLAEVISCETEIVPFGEVMGDAWGQEGHLGWRGEDEEKKDW